MGGSEMFTSNKVEYLRSHGWSVKVFFSCSNKTIKLDNLRQFSSNCIPEIGFAVYFIRKHKRDHIIERICEGIEKGDETIVESHLLGLGYWGELVAKKCGGRNILNAMEENINPLSNKEADFVEFKLKRWEILNASIKSLHRYFNNRYKEEYAFYTHNMMQAYCSNVTIDDNTFKLNLPSADYNIMSIGRLDKPYIKLMFDEVLFFAMKYPLKRINILIIGGSPDGTIEKKIKNQFNDILNVSVLFYGYLFPIPNKLIQAADASIAMANSILVTSDQGIPTIALDIHDLKPIGVFERTTFNQFSRDSEPIQKISKLLEEILIYKKHSKMPPKKIDVNKKLEEVFEKQIHFLDLSAKESIEHYDIDSIYSFWTKLYFQVRYLFIK